MFRHRVSATGTTALVAGLVGSQVLPEASDQNAAMASGLELSVP
jgi:hypothetical protein